MYILVSANRYNMLLLKFYLIILCTHSFLQFSIYVLIIVLLAPIGGINLCTCELPLSR